jgi:hypothetical protein
VEEFEYVLLVVIGVNELKVIEELATELIKELAVEVTKELDAEDFRGPLQNP